MSSSYIVYATRPDATPAVELSALAAVFSYALDCQANRNATDMASINGDDATVKSGKEVTHVDQRPG